MYKYTPGDVYTNITKMFGYRGVQPIPAELTSSQLSNQLATYEYVKLEGGRVDSRGVAQNVYVYMTSPGSKYALKAPDFRKLFNTIPREKLNSPTEVMIVSELEVTNHINKQIEELSAEYPNLYIEHHTYQKFLFEVPKNVQVSRHEIMTPDEFDAYSNITGVTRDDLPKILVGDPPVVWIGAKPGDVVKIYRSSESAGKAIGMRTVISG